MKVRILKKINIDGWTYYPGPEILDIWPTAAKRGILSGQLEDIDGNFSRAWTAREAYKKEVEKRKEKGTK